MRATATRSSDPRPLADLRVLDLTWVLSGPFAAMQLADLGAQVIKIEPPEGEYSRTVPRRDPASCDEGLIIREGT